jgi:predicted kinase
MFRMKKCKECGERNQYGYHSLNCKVITSYWTKALAQIKGEQQ